MRRGCGLNGQGYGLYYISSEMRRSTLTFRKIALVLEGEPQGQKQ